MDRVQKDHHYHWLYDFVTETYSVCLTHTIIWPLIWTDCWRTALILTIQFGICVFSWATPWSTWRNTAAMAVHTTLFQKIKNTLMPFYFLQFVFFFFVVVRFSTPHRGYGWSDVSYRPTDPGSVFITFLAWLGKKINWPFVKWPNNFLFAVVE